jgi:carbamoyl-phosphate synthase large subunit
VFTRQKLRMRAGETDKSLAVKDKKLSALILDLLAVMPLSGPVDIDCFQMDDAYVISEINPRFGGGYPHAYECGENYMAYLLQNASGMANRPRIGQYREGSMMIKYDDVMMVGKG